MSLEKLKSKFFNGAFITDVKHYFAKINEIIDHLNNNSYTPSYLVYTALLTQSGTDAPVATVLENTLGVVPVWSYDDVGYYKLTSAGIFTDNKTFIQIDYNKERLSGGIQAGSYRNIWAYKDDGETDFIWLRSQYMSQGATELTFIYTDGVANRDIRVKIEVYN